MPLGSNLALVILFSKSSFSNSLPITELSSTTLPLVLAVSVIVFCLVRLMFSAIIEPLWITEPSVLAISLVVLAFTNPVSEEHLTV
jgi:hypothetical protein